MVWHTNSCYNETFSSLLATTTDSVMTCTPFHNLISSYQSLLEGVRASVPASKKCITSTPAVWADLVWIFSCTAMLHEEQSSTAAWITRFTDSCACREYSLNPSTILFLSWPTAALEEARTTWRAVILLLSKLYCKDSKSLCTTRRRFKDPAKGTTYPSVVAAFSAVAFCVRVEL